MSIQQKLNEKLYDRADVLFFSLLLVDESLSQELIDKLLAAIDVHLPLERKEETNAD